MLLPTNMKNSLAFPHFQHLQLEAARVSEYTLCLILHRLDSKSARYRCLDRSTTLSKVECFESRIDVGTSYFLSACFRNCSDIRSKDGMKSFLVRKQGPKRMSSGKCGGMKLCLLLSSFFSLVILSQSKGQVNLILDESRKIPTIS